MAILMSIPGTQPAAAAAACGPGAYPPAFASLVRQWFGSVSASENVLVSPASLTAVLRLLASGARGATRELLQPMLQDRYCSPPSQAPWTSVSSVWLAPGSRLNPGYAALVKQCCAVEIKSLAVGKPGPVNDWVNRATHGRVRQIIDRVPDSVRILLVNAIYYRGAWVFPFSVSATTALPFLRGDGTQVIVPMLTGSGVFGYLRRDGHVCLQLPMADRRVLVELWMVDSQHGYESALRMAFSPEAAKPLVATFGRVQFPKLSIRTAGSVRAVLRSAGMGLLFDASKADFSAMLDAAGSAVDDIHQSVTLAIDEHGVESAAATSASLVGSVAPRPVNFDLRFDRPFLLVLRDNLDGDLISVAWVRDPS